MSQKIEKDLNNLKISRKAKKLLLNIIQHNACLEKVLFSQFNYRELFRKNENENVLWIKE